MTTTTAQQSTQGSSTAYVTDIVDMVAIYEDQYNCCVLQRDPDEAILTFVNRIDTPIRIQQLISPEDNMQELLFNKLPPTVDHPPGVHAFIDDLAEIIEIYTYLTDAKQIGLRLISLDKAMCPGFHVDKVGIRLVCTYKGPASEWLEKPDVDRTKLGLVAQGIPDDKSGIIKHPENIRSMTPFDIGLLKGESWMTQQGTPNQGNGIVHRSPSVDSAEQGLRLLLTLDTFE
jgi:hypothetical protein